MTVRIMGWHCFAKNINTLLKKPELKPDIDDFVYYLYSKINTWINNQEASAVTSRLAASIENSYCLRPSFKKRVGQLVALIPMVGKRIIEKSRKKELEAEMASIVTTETEVDQLREIRNILKSC